MFMAFKGNEIEAGHPVVVLAQQARFSSGHQEPKCLREASLLAECLILARQVQLSMDGARPGVSPTGKIPGHIDVQ